MAERLRRELRVPPSAETRALVEEVRRGRVGATAPATQLPLPAPLARTARPEGRERPLARLKATWDDAATGTLRIAIATGEPGIGKTTLLGEFARRVHASGAAVLFGRSDEQGLLPYQPWVEALERHLDGVPPADDALARLLPSLAQRAPSTDPAGERYRAFEAVRTLLEETAAERPVLLVLDDLQWADPDSLQLLRHLARMAQDARVLIAISLRQAELTKAVSAALADLRREGPLVQLVLQGLDEEAVAAVLARHDASGDAAAYRERTGGNPFFLDELLREQAFGEPDGPPPGVREVIGRRIARLPGPGRCVLQAGAALGMEFEPLVLTTAERVVDGLAAAVGAGLLTQVGERRYTFPHALIRETVLADMSPSRKACMHLRIADVLAEQRGHAGEIAKHVRAAGECAPPRAADRGGARRRPPGRGRAGLRRRGGALRGRAGGERRHRSRAASGARGRRRGRTAGDAAGARAGAPRAHAPGSPRAHAPQSPRADTPATPRADDAGSAAGGAGNAADGGGVRPRRDPARARRRTRSGGQPSRRAGRVRPGRRARARGA